MTRDDKLAAAGHYVLGVLDDGERVEFERIIAADSELGEMVDRLSEQFGALDDTAQAEAIPVGMWDRIAAQTNEVTSSGPAPAEARPMALVRPTPWRATAFAMAASVVVAAGVGFLAGRSMQATSPAPTVIAVLIDEGSAMPGAIVEAFADDSVRVVPLEDFAVPDGQILEVWTLPDPETGPVSLGTFASAQDIRLTGPDLPVPQDGQLYEITLEPTPGSPIGRPTGPILVKGYAKPPIL